MIQVTKVWWDGEKLMAEPIDPKTIYQEPAPTLEDWGPGPHEYHSLPAPVQQEPVACKTLCELCVKRGYTFCANAVKTTPIYTTPPQRKPLTDEQIDAEFDAFASKFDHESNEWLDMGVDAYFRAGFKAAHGIKEKP